MGRRVTPTAGPRYGQPISKRSAGSRRAPSGGRPVAIYEAASRHPLIPRVYDPAPSVTARQQRYLQTLARHLYRNDAFIRNLVNVAGRLYVGAGPEPLSRFPELDDLWRACSGQFDNTGRRSFGGWLRQDVYRNFRIDGEVFVRRRVRDDDAPEARRLTVPVEWEAHTSEFCPHEYTQVAGSLAYVNGVASVRSKPVSYMFWTSHPHEVMPAPTLFPLRPGEIYHVHDPLTGSTRGEVMLAAALLRAIKVATIEDSEMRRKQVASLMSVFIERPMDDMPTDVEIPDEDEIGEMIDSISLAPGGVYQLPLGHKMTSFTPADEPASFEKALRWQLMAICASVGIPINEVTGDEGVERWGRMMSQRVQSQAGLERDMLEHQLLDPMRADFIDAAMARGLWTPPSDMRPWELYQCEWQWPVIPAARLDQELNSLMNAVEKGHLPHSHVSRVLFGMTPETVARTAARDAARGDALGLQWTDTVWKPDTEVAARIGVAASDEEAKERDLVDAAGGEDSVLD